MPNRSHFNPAHRTMNRLRREGIKHSSYIDYTVPTKTYHALFIKDAIEFLKDIPDSSIQLVLVDPPYNIELAEWDSFNNYMDWSRQWLNEIERILSPSGNFVIFGGFQYQDLKKGDLLEVMHYLRHNTKLRFVNLIIWYYKNGMSAHRFFANRHEELLWFAKTKKYYFDLDTVRIPYTEEIKKIYLKDKRLNPETVEKGKNPTNVWEINRLNANAKERVGHPTQKPLEIVRRLVRSLSYPGSLVLDFFAGSGTTGRVCIEERRHSILVDNDPELKNYLLKHLENLQLKESTDQYEILYDPILPEFYNLL
ncbi:MAG: DNA-methyltransferase [Candidatus Hodarchaeales archaeon]